MSDLAALKSLIKTAPQIKLLSSWMSGLWLHLQDKGNARFSANLCMEKWKQNLWNPIAASHFYPLAIFKMEVVLVSEFYCVCSSALSLLMNSWVSILPAQSQKENLLRSLTHEISGETSKVKDTSNSKVCMILEGSNKSILLNKSTFLCRV